MKKKSILFFAAVLLCVPQAFAKSVMCLKTNSGQYIELARVSMMVVPDGGSTFEIVVRDGEGATGVESISFEKHESDIDLSKYGSSSTEETVDMSKPVFLLTSTGKYFYMKELPTMTARDGSSKFDLTVGSTTESDVSFVYFYRGAADNVEEVIAAGIDTPRLLPTDEQLRLQSPISSQMTISGCGAAAEAVVFGADGRIVGRSAVSNGMTTIQCDHLSHGVYIVKVGKKALKFLKK